MVTRDYRGVVDSLLEEHGGDEVVHYGRKGMRWGVRRSRKELARGKGSSDIPTVKVSKRGGRVQKVNVDLKGKGGRPTPAVINVKTQRVRARSMDSVEKERIESIVKEFGTDAVSSERLRAYTARVDIERKVNALNPPKQNPAKKFVSDLLTGDAEKLSTTGDIKQTSTYKLGSFGVELAKKANKKLKG